MKQTVIRLLTGGAIPPLLLLVGGFFLLYLRGAPLRFPRRMLRAMTHKNSPDGVSPFRAVTLALAGTLGVGNIVGVANALRVGGAGALFWMWVSALLAMVLKYAEILLAVSHRRTAPDGTHTGSAVCYIRDRFPSRAGTALAAVFGGLTVLDALSMGCVIQVNAVSSALHGTLGLPLPAAGALLLVLSVPVILRPPRAVSALTEYLVPIMSLGYLVLSLAVLILRREAVAPALASVFREAFHPQSAAGGFLGFLTCRALRVGTMRGLLSNEAGCGTAPTAHACAATDSPASQGVWGIFEVFADTILLCTVTALVILVSFPSVKCWGDNAVMMTISAYTGVLLRGGVLLRLRNGHLLGGLRQRSHPHADAAETPLGTLPRRVRRLHSARRSPRPCGNMDGSRFRHRFHDHHQSLRPPRLPQGNPHRDRKGVRKTEKGLTFSPFCDILFGSF